MKNSIIVTLLISIFILFSCEDSDRIEAIKSELRNKNKDEKNNDVDSQRKVSISAPSQNEAPYEELTTNYSVIEDYNQGYDDYMEDENYEEEYEDY